MIPDVYLWRSQRRIQKHRKNSDQTRPDRSYRIMVIMAHRQFRY